jgi:hypothetical protein
MLRWAKHCRRSANSWKQHVGGDEPMLCPQEHHEDYQRALAWVGEQVEEAEWQGLTLDYVGGWHTFKPPRKALEQAWRVLYGVPKTITHLMTSPQWPWAEVVLVWLRHHHERG